MKHLILLFLFLLALLLVVGCSGKSPDNLGLHDGRLAPCPETDNCVSSQSDSPPHAVAPIKAQGGEEMVMAKLADVIESMFGAKIIKIDGPYLHAEFTSRVFRFVDDVECHYIANEDIIHIRSASRIGHSDFNANRERVEEIRQRFKATM